ncbi:MAG: ADP-ribosylglycohydrolase family protein, partial [Deinococcus sp.]
AGRSGGMNAWVKGGMDNAGNGGLMRVAGVYLAGLRGVELTDAAITVTALTHADPCCILASIFMVKLLEQLDSHRLPYKEAADVAWESTEEAERVVSVLEAESFFSDTTMTPEGYVKLLRKALRKVGERVDAGVAGVKQKQTGYVLDTLQAALALQHGATSWMEVAEGAALAGDDSDTVGCVAGAIAGAQGFEVPAELLVDLRVGASWGDWQQEWPSERLEGLL